MSFDPASRTSIKGRIVVAMSGGVDSSVAAALMAEEGYDVVGITLQLYDHGAAVGRKGACCAGQDIHDARRVAETVGIPHYVLDYEERFKKAVIDDFADSYLAGETPIPCVRCNERVKFKDLLETAKDLGAEALVTGHYVQRVEGPNKVEMHRAVDPDRDQSYFLFSTTQDQLDFLRFPLGGRPKSETRALAERLNLPVAAKPDSQDICFVPTGSYASIVSKLRPGAIDTGEIVHMDGRVLGTHDGIINFTVGQRRGLKLGGAETAGEPLYVVKLDPVSKRVIVGPKSALATPAVRVRTLNWLGDAPLTEDPMPVLVKVRSTMEPVPATIRKIAQSDTPETMISFVEPLMGVSPGQAAVVYGREGDGSRVLGGGWIAGPAGTAPV
ncbi:MAG: tRNA 2-thiouridine(34) synthase MnmA [Alphaproteobacteria bacterium]|nr:tRNA 2-thiouridine(34) synthase MnmA [Alphaproteobacteria bacterium]